MTVLKPMTLRSGRLEVQLGSSPHEITAATSDVTSIADLCRASLREPVEFPQLHECTVPGDSVVIAVDPEVPALVEIIPLVVEQFQSVPEDGVKLTLLLPEDPRGLEWSELIEALPLHAREQMTIVIHQPLEQKQQSYLASSAGGDRLYLNTALVDADLIVSLGLMTHDSTIGIRGTASGLFPLFSNSEGRAKFLPQDGQASSDSTTELRSLVDEVGWLLGTQFTIQIVPAVADCAPLVLSGASDAVLDQGRDLLSTRGRIAVSDPVESVVISIPANPGLEWKQLGQALSLIAAMVESDGRVIVIADVPEPVGPAATMLRRCQEPSELLRPLQHEPVPDGLEIAQLIRAIEHVRVFLFSRLPADVVEELRMIPVADQIELDRLLKSCASNVLVIPNANYCLCQTEQRSSRRRASRISNR